MPLGSYDTLTCARTAQHSTHTHIHAHEKHTHNGVAHTTKRFKCSWMQGSQEPLGSGDLSLCKEGLPPKAKSMCVIFTSHWALEVRDD